jgi:hypothetical protein
MKCDLFGYQKNNSIPSPWIVTSFVGVLLLFSLKKCVLNKLRHDGKESLDYKALLKTEREAMGVGLK